MEKKFIVVSDVDGCLTNGNFIYTEEGKIAKIFGPHDNDGVKLLKKHGVEVKFISADKRGFPITKKRIEDMKCTVEQVTEEDRSEYLRKIVEEYDKVVFFGDGIGDALAYVKNRDHKNLLFVAPANARFEAKKIANTVTDSEGGNGAFLDMAILALYEFGFDVRDSLFGF